MPAISICSASSLESQVRREATLVADGRRQARARAACLSARGRPRRPSAGSARSSRRRSGTTMNSWKSTLLSAWAPPLSTFIIGTGSSARLGAAEVAPQRQALLGGLRVGGGERHAEDRVGAEPRLVGRAVELDQRPVERLLVGGVACPSSRRGDLAVDVGHRARHALAPPRRAAVAQLGRLELARGGARGHRRAAVRAGAQRRPPPRRSGCRGCRGSGARGRARSRSRARPAPPPPRPPPPGVSRRPHAVSLRQSGPCRCWCPWRRCCPSELCTPCSPAPRIPSRHSVLASHFVLNFLTNLLSAFCCCVVDELLLDRRLDLRERLLVAGLDRLHLVDVVAERCLHRAAELVHLGGEDRVVERSPPGPLIAFRRVAAVGLAGRVDRDAPWRRSRSSCRIRFPSWPARACASVLVRMI